MTIFAARGQGIELVNDGNFMAKKGKIENFEQNLCYVAQKKLKTCRIQIQVEKIRIFEKKISSLKFFRFFFQRGDPLMSKSSKKIFSIFQKF